ncbi:acetoacetyl-CoA synthetase [Saccharopolyspora lacisalsi]|uniref:Acetoacetyl-CoA synthetase n=1 Tax=Halosaccharopolyspora lacisalsi TaxID=1000566 RepID=A0A839E0Z9_9PSEU|nr:acetoacetate--CoA ligase [Halosaccharopolyspora lacisalsi]MBA8827454.1 acetoacetyl-CoA synthetase [Halosaccharopolyspora lacisalsi]
MTSNTPEHTPELLWEPSSERVRDSRMERFREWLRSERDLDLPDYRALWRWSVTDLEGFWGELADFFDVDFHDPPERVLTEEVMPGAEWFPGATLNYAEHALRDGAGRADEDQAVIFAREDGLREELTFGQLRARVAATRAGLAELGVQRGDRVVALAPNSPETLIAFLATASLGAVWSSCSPDFGLRAVAERFVQIEPKVLIAVGGYVYGGRSFDIRSTVDDLAEQLPGLSATVLIDYLDTGASLDRAVDWGTLLERHRDAELVFDAVPFDHPLWVLYSSGTTGLPKGIVHGHGGMTLEHLKAIGLHADLGPGDRFFWFTTTGWMMWNFLVGGLLAGATIVLFDGSPAYPSLTTLWELNERHRVDYFGTSAPFIQSCLKKELRPGSDYDLSALRTIGSTGAPLSTDGFRWIADAVGPDVQIASVSGGTDLCTAFVGAAPDVPVWLGELSCPMLGASVAAYDENGNELHGEVGELVITKPMPTMPVFFWNDPDGARLRDAYFDTFPGVWRHGDWVKITERGTLVIYGRSDSTLNRGGIRMGTAEFYRVVEGFESVVDSLVVDTSGAGESEGELLCFLVLAEGASLDELQPELKAALRAELSPRHVPNRFIQVSEVPHTLNGKKLEVPVKKILAGAAPDQAVSRDALSNPDALTPFVQLGGGSKE